MTSVSKGFPYVEGDPGESDKHLRLKGLAVYWLLCKGFELDDIEEEYVIKKGDNPGRGGFAQTDVYGCKGEQEVFIEAETHYHSPFDLSLGGKIPARRGEDVYLFTEDGIHSVEHTTMVGEHRYRDETTERIGYNVERICGLPILDLGAFSD